MNAVNLIHPSFFLRRGPQRSRNPIARMQNLRRVDGPTLLLKNALLGFKHLPVNVVINPKFSDFKPFPFWIPSGDLSLLSKMEIEALSKTNLTLGPNIDFFNEKNLNVIRRLNSVKILVPHHWVIPPVSQALPSNCRVYVWHSGIDTNFWRNKRMDVRRREVLIYVKDLNEVENLRRAEAYLRKFDFSFTTLVYGSYSQPHFKSVLNRVVAAIWIGSTESQGLALIECWSMDIPTLVLKKNIWCDPIGNQFQSSSAPFMSDSTGLFSSSSTFSENDFHHFFSKLDDFSPREYVNENFDLVDCASSLLKLLSL